MPRHILFLIAIFFAYGMYYIVTNVKPEAETYIITSMTYHPNACGCKKYDLTVRKGGSIEKKHIYVEKAVYDSKTIKDTITEKCWCNVFNAVMLCYLGWKAIAFITIFHFRNFKHAYSFNYRSGPI